MNSTSTSSSAIEEAAKAVVRRNTEEVQGGDVMRVRDGKIVEHWGVANLFSLMQQLGAWRAATEER